MSNLNRNGFPGGSKSRVNRAGDRVRAGEADAADLAVIEEWRAAHRSVLNTFQASLRTRTRYKNITVAQRHKRKRTIFDKLHRLPHMKLARMDDIAGCRLIFESIDDLYSFRTEFHKARFKHKRRGEVDRYDYIMRPKPDGYRGVHDVYEYDVISPAGKALKGLYVEIQYRSRVQHAWATANEVIGFITTSQPKFQRGDQRYISAMRLAAEILARSHEGRTGALPDMTDRTLVEEFVSLNRQLNLLVTLRGLNAADAAVSEKRNAILIFRESDKLEIREFRDATTALSTLFELETEFPDLDIVLVRADSAEEVRLAFRNYFSDANEFINLVEEGLYRLDGHM